MTVLAVPDAAPDPDPPTLGELVHERRRELGMTMRDAEAASGMRVSRTTWSAVEAGRTNLGEDVMRGLAAALDLPTAQLDAAAHRRFELPERAQRLDSESRATLLLVMDSLLASQRRRS